MEVKKITTESIMVYITSVYVIATIFICVFNYKSAMASKEQVAKMKEQHDESIRQYTEDKKPFIAVFPIINYDNKFCFEFKNIGNSIAKNIRVNFQDNIFKDFERKKVLFDGKITHKSLVIAPGQKIYYVLEDSSIGNEIITLFRMGMVYVSVSFEDSSGCYYTYKQIVDTSLINYKELSY